MQKHWFYTAGVYFGYLVMLIVGTPVVFTLTADWLHSIPGGIIASMTWILFVASGIVLDVSTEAFRMRRIDARTYLRLHLRLLSTHVVVLAPILVVAVILHLPWLVAVAALWLVVSVLAYLRLGTLYARQPDTMFEGDPVRERPLTGRVRVASGFWGIMLIIVSILLVTGAISWPLGLTILIGTVLAASVTVLIIVLTDIRAR